MKNILCYGDSNTWGYDALTKDRFPPNTRWHGILRKELGDGYLIIEEGLNGRTTVWDDPIEGEWKNGLRYLTPCLESHAPLDLVIIMLGTNDLKMRYSVSTYDIAKGLERLVKTVQSSSSGRLLHSPQLLILAPPPLVEMTEFAEMFTGANKKSYMFGQLYMEVADLYCCHFLDTSCIISSCNEDGIHLSQESHQKLGLTVAERVQQIIPI
jgi:lysophospholipase L1-like esterase